MRLEITQKHITKANRLRELAGYKPHKHCVLAVAITEQYPKEQKRYNGPFSTLSVLDGPRSRAYNLASNIAGDFDFRQKVKPCTLSWRKRKEEQEVREGVEG